MNDRLILTQEQADQLGTIVWTTVFSSLLAGREGDITGYDTADVGALAQVVTTRALSVIVAGETGTRLWTIDGPFFERIRHTLAHGEEQTEEHKEPAVGA